MAMEIKMTVTYAPFKKETPWWVSPWLLLIVGSPIRGREFYAKEESPCGLSTLPFRSVPTDFSEVVQILVAVRRKKFWLENVPVPKTWRWT